MTPDLARHIFIGDVHGCLDELRLLLRKIAPRAEDKLVFVGDLVAKGPDSAGVVGLARELSALCVRGNHDEAVLRYRRSQQQNQEPPRLKKGHIEVAKSLSERDWAYLEGLPLWLTFPQYGALVVHAGLVPGLAFERQQPDTLMNMRSIRADGSPSSRMDEGRPWAELWQGPQRVIFGHDAVSGLQQRRFATGLDTGCVYGRELTALVLPENKLVSVPATRAYKEISG
jgi:hypothetical protein